MKKTHITLIGTVIATLGLGAGVTVTKAYNKTAVERTASDSAKKETLATTDVANDKENSTIEEDNVNNEITSESTDVKSTGESNSKNENISKDNTKKESVTTNSGNTVDVKTETQNNNKPESNTTVNINKEENSIYKVGVTKADIEKVYDKYCKNVGAMYSEFGSHFRHYGQLIFSGEGGDAENVEKFYTMSDKTLNDLWSGLKTILSESEMKALTKEENQWIKEKENIKEDATPILSAETNTQYAQAEATYKRAISLAKKYLM